MKTLEEILERFRAMEFEEEFDLIVAIANGGIIPAAILNQRLRLEMRLLYLGLRDDDQQLLYDSPRLLYPVDFEVKKKRVLVVDDRVNTGATLVTAWELLAGAKYIRTFAVNGQADYSLYNEPCFPFPWNL